MLLKKECRDGKSKSIHIWRFYLTLYLDIQTTILNFMCFFIAFQISLNTMLHLKSKIFKFSNLNRLYIFKKCTSCDENLCFELFSSSRKTLIKVCITKKKSRRFYETKFLIQPTLVFKFDTANIFNLLLIKHVLDIRCLSLS